MMKAIFNICCLAGTVAFFAMVFWGWQPFTFDHDTRTMATTAGVRTFTTVTTYSSGGYTGK